MNQMLPERSARGQFRVHLAALAVLLLAVWLPALARPAGGLFVVDCAWLVINLAAVTRRYIGFRNRVRAAA